MDGLVSTPLRVLLVEDSEDDAELLLYELRHNGYDVAVTRVETREQMASALNGNAWDVVISDYVMPRFSGLEALAMVKDSGQDLPFIVVSGKIGEDIAVEAMKAGAHDYIIKGQLARLAPAIQRELREAAVRRERAQMEQQLQRAQRLELAGQIAGQVVHDLKNLLSPLAGYPQLIKKRLPPDHPAAKLCDAMLKSIWQMNAITNDLVTLGRRGLIDQEEVSLNALVEEAVEQAGEQPDTLRIELALSDELALVIGSGRQLLRVISNLISNAREAMGDRGILSIKSQNVHMEKAFGRYSRIEPGDYVCLDVKDTGSGIPAEIRDKIFDPFFTTKQRSRQHGSGLGLSIVQTIVGDHHGYLDLETEIGRGTTISVYLPVHRKA